MYKYMYRLQFDTDSALGKELPEHTEFHIRVQPPLIGKGRILVYDKVRACVV
jgi:hypothetical protein